MPPDRPRSNVRRANVTACMRCKSRKQRCDQNLPACSNCAAANVECVSVDVDGRVAPRSYIKSLEDRVAHLEKQLISHGIRDYESPRSGYAPLVTPSGTTSGPYDDPQSPTRGISAVPSLIQSSMEHLASSEAGCSASEGFNSLLSELPYETHIGLPTADAASILLDTYFEHSDFFLPILCRSDFVPIQDALQRASSQSAEVSRQSRFRMMLVFAVAARLMNRRDAAFPISRSEAYYASAMAMVSAHAGLMHRADLENLENLLLIIQYCFFSSNITTAWHLLGIATRIAIEMDLHNEGSNVHGLPPAVLNRRRWAFWAACSLERILCPVLQRPFSIPEEAVNTPLPVVDDSDSSRLTAVHFIKHRRLSAEIHQTISQNPPANGATLDYEVWREAMREKMQDWLLTVPETNLSTQLAPTEIFEGMFHNTLVLIYSSSPPMPPPRHFDHVILARSASRSIEIYKLCFKEGKLRYYWRTTHRLFRCGLALVQCAKFMGSSGASLLDDMTLADIKASINTCQAVLWGMVERHHSGRAYRDAFDAIVPSIMNMSESTESLMAEIDMESLPDFSAIDAAELQDFLARVS